MKWMWKNTKKKLRSDSTEKKTNNFFLRRKFYKLSVCVHSHSLSNFVFGAALIYRDWHNVFNVKHNVLSSIWIQIYIQVKRYYYYLDGFFVVAPFKWFINVQGLHTYCVCVYQKKWNEKMNQKENWEPRKSEALTRHWNYEIKYFQP